jgi:hypothetical protein
MVLQSVSLSRTPTIGGWDVNCGTVRLHLRDIFGKKGLHKRSSTHCRLR